eukprot:CAMPEP_0114997110 /NCGR_PEP_ID=MMETSP0216-20121206/14711_1 /TAXON_ID=223996 /ORGANISM="Protocruzia adherens, Strain Boccale" /LENGTH=651 /DNA_ID=CAMNT_0002361443 /DNA_START=89 /DNA_END=2046 /DNA_ORIENTATION=+
MNRISKRLNKGSFSSLSLTLFQSGSVRYIHVPTLKDDIFTISIVGKPNVGKSTLFNRLTGQASSLVHAQPGITRDRIEHRFEFNGYPIRLVDTAGWEDANAMKDSRMMKKMMNPLERFDARDGITGLDFDFARWMHNQEKQFRIAQGLDDLTERRNFFDDVKIPEIMLIANKCERGYIGNIENDVYRLDYGSPTYISAMHMDGMIEFFQELDGKIPSDYKEYWDEKKESRKEKFYFYRQKLLDEAVKELEVEANTPENMGEGEESSGAPLSEKQQKKQAQANASLYQSIAKEWLDEFDRLNAEPEYNSDFDSDTEVNPIDSLTTQTHSEHKGVSIANAYYKKPIQISVIGRPNAGKSTMTNQLLREDRVIVDDLPGTTRDSVLSRWVYKGRNIHLIDTAGIKRAMTLKGDLDYKIYEQVKQSIRFSSVVIYVINSMDAITSQDIKLLSSVIEEGRGIILAANKWDLVEDKWKQRATKWMESQIEKCLGQIRDINIFYVSAKTGFRVNGMMNEVIRAYDKWNARVSTGLLNDWLRKFKKVQTPPSINGRRLRMRFICQVKTRPPTFFLYVNNKKLIRPNYHRFLIHSISEEFGFNGVPIRIILKDNKRLDKTPEEQINERLASRNQSKGGRMDVQTAIQSEIGDPPIVVDHV